jgi:hypothetical protein
MDMKKENDLVKQVIMENQEKKDKDMNATTGKGTGLRFNQGKLRHDLVHPRAYEDFVQVLTDGANKYKPKNWENGLSWTSVLASLKRHITAIEKGEDYDYDPNCSECIAGTCKSHSGRLHIAHAACNVHFLNAFYYIFPQGDDRTKIMGYRKYGIDIDSVLSDFVNHFFRYLNIDGDLPRHWNDPRINNNFNRIITDKNFWLTIPELIPSNKLIYEPDCYITSRPINSAWTQEWLDNKLYPQAKLFTVGHGGSKIEAAKSREIEVFLDDSFDNFIEFQNNGIDCYLYTASHNIKYNVGHKRVNCIEDFFKKIEIYST